MSLLYKSKITLSRNAPSSLLFSPFAFSSPSSSASAVHSSAPPSSSAPPPPFYFSFPPIPVSSSAASFSSVHFSISSSLMTSTYSFLLHLLPPPSRIPLILHIIMRRFWGYLGLIDVWRRLIFNVILVLLSSLRWFFSDRPDLMKHFLRDCWGSVCFLGFGGFWFLSVVGVWFSGFVGIFVRIRS